MPAFRRARLIDSANWPLATAAPLLRLAESRLASRTLAEDAVQEALLSAFKSRHTYNPQYTVRTWLWTILLNQCRAVWQRQKRHPQIHVWSQHGSTQSEGESDHGPLPADTVGNEPSPDVHLLAEERKEQFELLLGSLSVEQADALRLRFFGGLKFQEIADAMGCSLGTAKNRVRWGLEKMSAALSDGRAMPVDGARRLDVHETRTNFDS